MKRTLYCAHPFEGRQLIGAHEIGIAEATVKVHRSRAMQKMGARSLPELSGMADKLKLVSDEPERS
jgi:FixJ family two-component response regulator